MGEPVTTSTGSTAVESCDVLVVTAAPHAGGSGHPSQVAEPASSKGSPAAATNSQS